jgi:ATP-binding cassette, subfamily C, bacterial LapB
MSQIEQHSETAPNQATKPSAEVVPLSSAAFRTATGVGIGQFSSPESGSEASLSRDSDVAAEAPEPVTAPLKRSIASALESVAASWFGPDHDHFSLGRLGNPLAPETAAAYAAELGIDLEIRRTKLSRLRITDFPCLAIDRDGTCTLVVGRINHWALTCRTADGDRPIDRPSLEKNFSGTVFVLRPIERLVSSEASGDQDSASEPPIDSVMAFLATQMIRRRPGALAQLVTAAVLSNLILVFVPIFTMAVYDRVIPHLAFETLWALTIGMSIALAADLALRHVKVRIVDSISADISHLAQVRFYRHLLYGKLGASPRLGGTIAQTVRDLEGYCQLIPMVFISMAVDLPFVLVTSIILGVVGGSVAYVPFVGGVLVAAVFVVSHWAGHNRLAPFLLLSRLQQNTVVETIEGLETIKTASAEPLLLNKWENLADSTAFGSHMSRLAHAYAQQWIMTISQLMTILTLLVGVYEISINAMTVGALSASTMLIGRLFSPITQFVVQSQRLFQARKTLEPIRQIMNMEIENADSHTIALPRQFSGHFDFLNVTHAYGPDMPPSLRDVSLTIKRGERVGIIGRIGSGKSTLLRLMVRLLEPTEGAIRLDGYDIRQFAPRAIRSKVAYMKQDAALFDDTLKANLLLGLTDPNPDKVQQAVTISGVMNFVARSPKGYGFRVGPRGERLSGGEKQAVGLARVLAADPDVLLLDEPTASMDNTTERNIITGLSSWLNGKTLVVATHRAALLDLVDRVILVHDGRVVADGPKDQVLRKLQAG